MLPYTSLGKVETWYIQDHILNNNKNKKQTNNNNKKDSPQQQVFLQDKNEHSTIPSPFSSYDWQTVFLEDLLRFSFHMDWNSYTLSYHQGKESSQRDMLVFTVLRFQSM